MRKVFAPILIVAALALALSACDAQFNPSAARVGGASISVSSLNAAMDAQAKNPGFVCQRKANKEAITGAGGAGTYASSFAASTLAQLIQATASSLVVGRLHLHASPTFLTSLATNQLTSGFNGTRTSTCSASGAQMLAAFAAPYRKVLIGLVADEDLISAHAVGVALTSAGLAAYAKAHPAAVSSNCVSDIIVKSKAKAEGLVAQLNSGAKFATLAAANSLDSDASSGGAAGCAYPSQFNAPLNTIIPSLTVGQVSAPLSYNGDYLLLLVTSRTLAGGQQVANLIDAQPAATAGLRKQTSRLTISVDRAYGHWSTSTGEVSPPTGPPSKLVPNPDAVTPGAVGAG